MTWGVTSQDREIARAIADEVRALEGRRRTWRKVTSILDRFEVYRLTAGSRQRLTQALLEAGLELDPSLLEVDRYGTIRLTLAADDGAGMPPANGTERLAAVRDVLSASVWRPGEGPVSVELEDACETEAVLWLDVLATNADPAQLHAALVALCGEEITPELVDDLLAADDFPRVEQYEGVRLISTFSVEPTESESDAEDANLSKAGSLGFQPVEFLVAEKWVITCWQGTGAGRPDEVFDGVTGRWPRGEFRTAGDLALLVFYELATTYTQARRELYAWLESWELDFWRRHDQTEVETLAELRRLIAEFRKQLSELERSGLTENPELIWFPGVTDPAEAHRVDDLIDRALRDLRALSESLLGAINLVSTMTASRRSRQAESFQRVIAAGAAVLIAPALVATIYGANTWLPGRQSVSGFLIMFAVMGVTAAVTLAAVRSWQRRDLYESGPTEVASPSRVVVPHSQPAGLPKVPSIEPILVLYDYAASDPNSRTPAMIRVFAERDLLTPEEIGRALADTNGGVALTKQGARAVLRNLSRTQGNLLRAGRIDRDILVKDFTGYGDEGAGRYGLSEHDRAVLSRRVSDA